MVDNRKCVNCGFSDLIVITYNEGNICICKKCNLQFAKINNYIPSKYSKLSYYLSIKSFSKINKYQPFLEFFSTISSHKQYDLEILDVGCGSGAFIEFCLNKGYSISGLDSNRKLRTHLSAEILPYVTFVSFEEYIIKTRKKYDIITFWDSFEHMHNPFLLLSKCKRLLKKNGIIYLRVNNNYDFFNILSLTILRFIPFFGKKLIRSCFNFPDHLWNFSQQSMTELLNKRNMKIIECTISETPASRFSKNLFILLIINCLYTINKVIKGGKIANYYVQFK